MMVKFGEFSPLNPDLQSTGRSLVGLGEYEEKRRVFMEKKKREYLEQMAQTKALQITRAVNGKNVQSPCHFKSVVNQSEAAAHDVHDENSNFTNLVPRLHVSRSPSVGKQLDMSSEGGCLPFIPATQGMNSRQLWTDEPSPPPLSPGDPCITARDRKLADLRQSFFHVPQTPCNDVTVGRRHQDVYQEELRRQIEEKRRLEAEAKERARIEEEVIARRLARQQEQMQREVEREEAQRKAVAEKRARQLELVLRRQEELEREAAELRKETRMKLVKQEESNPSDVLSAHLPSPAVPPGNTHTSRRHVEQSATGAGAEEPSRITEHAAVPRWKVHGSERHRWKESVVKEQGGVTAVSRQSSDGDGESGGVAVRSMRTRAPLRMFQSLGVAGGNLEDTLPIPVFRSRSPVVPAVQHRAALEPVPHGARRYSEGMQVLVSKWEVPAVQKTSLQTTGRFLQVRHNNELTQLGAFRRQLQLEQLRMDELLLQQQSVKKA